MRNSSVSSPTATAVKSRPLVLRQWPAKGARGDACGSGAAWPASCETGVASEEEAGRGSAVGLAGSPGETMKNAEAPPTTTTAPAAYQIHAMPRRGRTDIGTGGSEVPSPVIPTCTLGGGPLMSGPGGISVATRGAMTVWPAIGATAWFSP